MISEEPADYNAASSRSYYIAVMYQAMPQREYAVINTIADGAVPDVPVGTTAYEAIYGFYRAGILTGYEDGSFGIDRQVKRSEVATLLARMFDPSVRKNVDMT